MEAMPALSHFNNGALFSAFYCIFHKEKEDIQFLTELNDSSLL